MKIIIEINSGEDARKAHDFLSRALGGEAVVINTTLPPLDIRDAQRSDTGGAEKTDKPARKPRSDAGKTREPYTPRTDTNAGAGTAASSTGGTTATGAAAGDPVAAGGSPVTSTAAAPAPTVTAASTPPQAPASTGASSAAPSTEEFPASLEGARKAMKALDGTANKGMDACIASLRAYGVNRITDLPKEKYGEFIKGILVQCSPEGLKIAREWAEKAAPKK